MNSQSALFFPDFNMSSKSNLGVFSHELGMVKLQAKSSTFFGNVKGGVTIDCHHPTGRRLQLPNKQRHNHKKYQHRRFTFPSWHCVRSTGTPLHDNTRKLSRPQNWWSRNQRSHLSRCLATFITCIKLHVKYQWDIKLLRSSGKFTSCKLTSFKVWRKVSFGGKLQSCNYGNWEH